MKIVIAIPAYNEALILEKNIKKLLDFCSADFLKADDVVIVIANNNSSDNTSSIADSLASLYPTVEHIFIPQKGKGLAISTAWNKYEADLYCFMDADLATDLSALGEAIIQIQTGADIVIGSRFHKLSQVQRSGLRKFISQCYRLFFKTLFKIKVNDFPCGFKIITKKVRVEILKDIVSTGFFWDTEMLVLANQKGFKIVEIPVIWRELADNNRISQVNIVKTSLNYIKESLALKIRLLK